ncbi:MAG: hypothetical protein ACRD45_18190 [Bryobacteraceae bacterium]
MGRWAGNNKNLGDFYEVECNAVYLYQTWNDCISSIDNDGTSGCDIHWDWGTGYGTPVWAERVHVAHGSIGTSNDEFSSDWWCSKS